MKVLHNTFIAILVFLASLAFFVFALFENQLSSVSKEKNLKEVTIEKGSIEKVATTLYKEGLIKNVLAFKIYSRLSGKTNLQAATYRLSPNMGTKKIIDILQKGDAINNKQVNITFKEGYNIPKFINIITEKTNIKEEDIKNVLKDKEYLKELITEYWFLTDDILNDKIYYSLEGYLYPNTYFFSSKDVTIKEVIKTLLDETKKQLSPYRDKISANNRLVQNILFLVRLQLLMWYH